MTTIHDMLKCPKCQKRFLGKSVHPKFGKEYFCHRCHEYFGVNELVNFWGYDAADLSPIYPVTFADYKGWYKNFLQKDPYWESTYHDFGNEPFWFSLAERDDAYQMVNRMFLGIQELDDYQDLKNTQMGALQ